MGSGSQTQVPNNALKHSTHWTFFQTLHSFFMLGINSYLFPHWIFLYIIKFWVSFKDLFIHVMNMSKLLLSSDTPEEGHKWFICSMWLLGIGLRTSGRAVSILNCWAISSAPWFCFRGRVSECNLHCLRNCYIGQVVPNDKCHYQTKIIWEAHPCDLCFTLLL